MAGLLLVAFAVGWFAGDLRVLWLAALLGVMTIVVNLTAEDRDTPWTYGLVLGVGAVTAVGVVMLVGVAVRRGFPRTKGQGWLDLR